MQILTAPAHIVVTARCQARRSSTAVRRSSSAWRIAARRRPWVQSGHRNVRNPDRIEERRAGLPLQKHHHPGPAPRSWSRHAPKPRYGSIEGPTAPWSIPALPPHDDPVHASEYQPCPSIRAIVPGSWHSRRSVGCPLFHVPREYAEICSRRRRKRDPGAPPPCFRKVEPLAGQSPPNKAPVTWPSRLAQLGMMIISTSMSLVCVAVEPTRRHPVLSARVDACSRQSWIPSAGCISTPQFKKGAATCTHLASCESGRSILLHLRMHYCIFRCFRFLQPVLLKVGMICHLHYKGGAPPWPNDP